MALSRFGMLSALRRHGPYGILPERGRIDVGLSRSPSFLFLLVSVLLSLAIPCRSYRIGDPVNLLIRTPSENTDALRNQMPLFGISTSTSIDIDEFSMKQLSLSFADGTRSIPWFGLMDGRRRQLESLTVTFVYSSSGGGEIHTVNSQTKYTDDNDTSQPRNAFRVDYVWIEEADVDVAGGAFLMFVITMVVSLVFLLQACVGLGSDEDYSHGEIGNEQDFGTSSTDYPGYLHQDPATWQKSQ